MYRPGWRILAADYNNLIGNINSDQATLSEADSVGRLSAIWGVGYGHYGFCQRSEPWRLRLQSPYMRVLHEDWFRMQDALRRLLLHGGTSSPMLPAAGYFEPGDRVLVHDTGYGPGDFDSLVPIVDDPVYRTRYALDNPGAYIVDSDIIVDTVTTSWGLAPDTNFISTYIALIWSDGDAARGFWNAGGELRARLSHPRTGSVHDQRMADLLDSVGTYVWQRDRVVHTGTAVDLGIDPPGGYWNATVYTPPLWQPVRPSFRVITHPSPDNDLRCYGAQNVWKATNVTGNGDNGSVFVLSIVLARLTPSTNPADALSAGTTVRWDLVRPRWLPDPSMIPSIVLYNTFDSPTEITTLPDPPPS